ncbi:MAG: hypothetical protein K8R31_04315 [Bacteroidales bacterium]|nr:hypothetical protein [Bacteroidales bacterium]
MNTIYTIADNIMTPLGFTTKDNFEALKQGKSGIELITDPKITQIPMYASIIDSEWLDSECFLHVFPDDHTRLEQMMITSIDIALKQTNIDTSKNDTLFIFSSTKGNIDLLENKNHPFDKERLNLWALSDEVCKVFKSPVKPIFISNACISGVTAIITGAQYLKMGKYKNVIICGGDIISEFTPSGFQSFKAISEAPCKPFDGNREGINLGEGAGTIILSTNENLVKEANPVIFRGGANTNDANHISGPSRTGDGLYYAIRNTLKEAGKIDKNIDYISAHGTATLYNDEMESKAISWAELEHVPVNSFKGYWGHTLGAAGIIECIAGIHSIKENYLIKTLGYSDHGVSKPINVIKEFKKTKVKNFLKTTSGFGGSNAAAYFSELDAD